MRKTLLLPVFATLLSAQYADLATTADGSIVFFSTTLRRSGAAEPEQGRIFVIGPGGLQLHAERQRQEFPGVPAVTNYYWLSAPEVSADGRTMAISGRRECLGGHQCLDVPTNITNITAVNGRIDLAVRGRVRLSPNGRYALRQGPPELGGDTGGLLDLVTGQESLAREWERGLGQVTYPGLPVADDGSVLHVVNGQVWLNRGPAAQSLTDLLHESAFGAVTDAATRVVVYVSRWRHPHAAFSRIRLVEPVGGSRRTLIEGLGDFYQPVLSHDGQRVLFLTTSRFDNSGRVGSPQAYVIGIDGEGLRSVTQDPSGIHLAVLSGDGRVAYALTRSGRLLRADIDAGTVTELLPRNLWLTSPGDTQCGAAGSPVAGSLRRITSVGYTGPDGVPEPVRVSFGGIEAPVVSQSPGELLFQTPWELAGQTLRFDVDTAIPPGPFEQPATHDVYIAAHNPCFLPLPEEYGTDGPYGMRFSLAVDQNYRAMVTPDNPARAGAIVNLYGLGFGPVLPAVPTGEPAPASGPLSHLTIRFQCETFSFEATYPVPVLFAGLAPGTVGLYQVQLQIPPDLTGDLAYRDAIQVSCRDSGATASFSFTALLPVSLDRQPH
jgi:uncharacterized protein (TIGR03437 family)